MVAAHVRQTMTARSRAVTMTTRGMALGPGGEGDDNDVIRAMIARVKTRGRGWWHRSEPEQVADQGGKFKKIGPPLIRARRVGGHLF